VRVDEHTIELGGEPVFFRSGSEPGETPPPILYLHGAPTSSEDWLPFLERTGGLAPDLPGFGRSGKGGHLEYTLDGLATFVERFIEDFAQERDLARLALVAHDWGAAAGAVFAQRHPERVRRLVLIDPVPLLDGFTWHRLARIWRRPLIGELTMGMTNRKLLARALRQGATHPLQAWPQPKTDAVWRQFDQGTQRALLRLHRDGGEQQLAVAGAGLHAITAPALLIWGAEDPWLPAGLGDRYAARLPNATVDVVEGAGHWPWLDRPEVVDRVAEFLA
jgi:pimeloyl-ACP methyl ester carboxylesterase